MTYQRIGNPFLRIMEWHELISRFELGTCSTRDFIMWHPPKPTIVKPRLSGGRFPVRSVVANEVVLSGFRECVLGTVINSNGERVIQGSEGDDTND